MNRTIIEIAGWFPAIIIPVATLIQLVTILRKKSAMGVSWITWTLFGLANIGLYIYTEKYMAAQAILGFLGTALLDFIIAGLAIIGYGSQHKPVEDVG